MKPDKSQWSQWKLGGNPNKTKLTNTTRRGKKQWNRWKWHHKKLYGLGIRFGVGSSDKQTQRRNFGSFAAKWLGPILGTRDLIFYFLLLRRFVVEAARVEARGRRRYFRDYRRAPFRRFLFFWWSNEETNGHKLCEHVLGPALPAKWGARRDGRSISWLPRHRPRRIAPWRRPVNYRTVALSSWLG